MVLIYSCLDRLHVLLMSKALDRSNSMQRTVLVLVSAAILNILNLNIYDPSDFCLLFLFQTFSQPDKTNTNILKLAFVSVSYTS